MPRVCTNVLLRDVVQALTDPVVAATDGLCPEQETESVDSPAHYWRRLVLAACREGREADQDGDEDLNPAGADLQEWDRQIECLADRILWDRDWELEQIMDASPEQARLLKRRLGIDEEYLLASPADPAVDQVGEATQFLRHLAKYEQGT